MTPERSRYHQWAYRFNSHPHKEDDRGISSLCKSRSVSTHILTRRMTEVIDMKRKLTQFQLTSSQGGWHWNLERLSDHFKFQLTSSQGGWRIPAIFVPSSLCFNSHPHKEDDSTSYAPRMELQLFQLTSSQGGWRRRTIKKFCFICVSTHILTRRMTKNYSRQLCMFHVSTHILTRRMTKSMVLMSKKTRCFNSHPHKEDDARKARQPYRPDCFNSHPHKEDDQKYRFELMESDVSTHILTRRMTVEDVTRLWEKVCK